MTEKNILPEDVFRSITDNSRDAIFLLSANRRFLYANRSAVQIFGLPEDVNEQPESPVLPEEVVKAIQTENNRVIQYDTEPSSGSQCWLETQSRDIDINGRAYKLVTLRDISHLKQKESQLKKEARTDFLSGLNNRRQFQKLLDANIDREICIAVVDVDHFKQINDCFGHLLGDAAIRLVGKKMLQSFGEAICVARLGGEEFGVILTVTDPDVIVESFEAFRESLEQCSFSDHQISLTVSVGLAFSSEKIDDGHALLDHADKAVYESKKSGRNRVTVAGN